MPCPLFGTTRTDRSQRFFPRPQRLCGKSLRLSPILLRSFAVPSVANLLTYSSTSSHTIPMPQPKKTNPEIEIKLRIQDIPATQRKIKSLGATFQPRVQEQNTLDRKST